MQRHCRSCAGSQITDPLQHGGLANAARTHDSAHLALLQLQAGLQPALAGHMPLNLEIEYLRAVDGAALLVRLQHQVQVERVVLAAVAEQGCVGVRHRRGRRVLRLPPQHGQVKALRDLLGRLLLDALHVMSPALVKEGADGQDASDADCSECAARDEESYDHLILGGLQRRGTAKDLSCHHARDGHEADDIHAIDLWDECRLYALRKAGPRGLPRRGAEGEQDLDVLLVAHKVIDHLIQGQRHPS
mmetsp:Transcript_9600/g.24880  ORF Transcript_9600/g.24880 Transcript_9600/m.24880 type:complete len:246 (-) Transcript_9600:311-1048(-)